jgi:hypothetical protein
VSPQDANSARREGGTASVELIAVVPALLLAILAAAQIGLAGYALWSAGTAARAGARAQLVGGDAAEVARRALPDALRGGAAVSDDGAVSVRLRVPRLLPGMPSLHVRAESSLGAGDG